ncbi:MAG: serine hydrolase [Pseudomonadota bacterium]
MTHGSIKSWLIAALLLTGCQEKTGLEESPATVTASAETPGDDTGLKNRLATIPRVRPWPLSWFEPKETIKGAQQSRGLPAGRPQPRLSQDAWSAALSYAKERDTDILAVWKDGAIDRIWTKPGYQPEQHLNTYYLNYFVLVTAIGIAIDDDAIETIDEPISQFLPEWKGQPRGDIKVRNLLEMNAGLEMYKDNIDPADKATRLFFGSQSTQAALEYDLKTAPGTLFEYNYVVPELLGIVLQRATGERYADFVSRRIWQPLGNDDAAVWLDREGGRPHFNAGLFADGDDWLRFAIMIAQGGTFDGQQIVPPSWIERMQQPSQAKENYGFVWLAEPFEKRRELSETVAYVVMANEPFATKDLMIFDGYGGQRLYVSTDEQLVILRIGATARDTWDDSYLPNLIAGGF